MFCCHVPLISGGRQIAQFRVQPHVVVEADDVLGDVARGLGMVGVVALPDPLHLQVQEEALHHGVVPAVALAAHARAQAVALEQGPVGLAGVLGGPNARSDRGMGCVG